jgi:hypothetical protein
VKQDSTSGNAGESELLSSVNKVRIGLHALMFLLGLVLAYDYLRQPGTFSYLLASILFLAYSSLRLYGPLKGVRSSKHTDKSEDKKSS